MNSSKLLRKLRNSELMDTSSWSNVCAVTLTLKQAIYSDGFRIAADELTCKKAFYHFSNLLNRAVYRNAVRRHGKRLKLIPVIEKETSGRWHYHVAIEPPAHMTDAAFERLIRDCWSRTDWGYRRIDVTFDANPGWVGYLLKPAQKSGLENSLDCIDWNSYNR